MKLFKNLLLAAGLTLAIPQAEAKVTLPSFFTDNMVLQQKTQVPFLEKVQLRK
jgi:sialate O-acetylesterase